MRGSYDDAKRERKKWQRQSRQAETNLKKMRRTEKRLKWAVAYNRTLKIIMIVLPIIIGLILDVKLGMKFGRWSLLFIPSMDVKIAFFAVILYEILLDRKPHREYEKLFGYYAKQWPEDQEILEEYQKCLQRTENEVAEVHSLYAEAERKFQDAVRMRRCVTA